MMASSSAFFCASVFLAPDIGFFLAVALADHQDSPDHRRRHDHLTAASCVLHLPWHPGWSRPAVSNQDLSTEVEAQRKASWWAVSHFKHAFVTHMLINVSQCACWLWCWNLPRLTHTCLQHGQQRTCGTFFLGELAPALWPSWPWSPGPGMLSGEPYTPPNRRLPMWSN